MGSGHEHGLGHGHGHSKIELPDHRQWKIEGTPLEAMQKKLAQQGLRDPWARNEAWRYMGGFANTYSFLGVIFKGFKLGFAAFVIAAGAEYLFESHNNNNNDH
ncbi:NADH dehydrogenase [ubiquinone] 1 beta subcomplex subunit 3 [Perognathus longimembris pacificus]|uniref:NADH dehydrogenase [ubiquinone] 1 beta subcomplex subunit 3 n=1 Tax=Perognathus longimembris pacificus TaxID=214514 RepID=UPI002019186C|nr:NADH dehydrogenase [ubiquinone] 1 beta subcomplex subunit 3 [Perognathus longimembris pacificus]